MPGYSHRDQFNATQIGQVLLTLPLLAVTLFLGGLAVDFHNGLGILLIITLGIIACVAGLLLTSKRTGIALLLTLPAITVCVLILLLTSTQTPGITWAFLCENMQLAWHALTN